MTSDALISASLVIEKGYSTIQVVARIVETF